MNDDQWEARLRDLRAIEAAVRILNLNWLMLATDAPEHIHALRLALDAPRWYTPAEREAIVNDAHQTNKIHVLSYARERVQMTLWPHWRNLTSDAQDELALLYYVTSQLRGFDT